MLGGRARGLWLALVACASSGRAPERAQERAPERAPERVPEVASTPAEPRREVADLKSLPEREEELAAERADRDHEREQERARRWLGCHPHRAAGLRFAVGSAELDARALAKLEALVRRWQGEPGAILVVLGARRGDEGEAFVGIDRRRAAAVRDALLARGVAAQKIVAAAEFRAPAAGREEVEVVWVCEVCCLL